MSDNFSLPMDAKLPDTARDSDKRQIVIQRVLEAPRELVWEAWTNPQHVAQWWGPHGFTTTVYEMDVRPGGVWRYAMHSPDGVDYPTKVVFIEVVAPERLVYWHGDDPDKRKPFHVTFTFDEQDGKTNLTMRMRFDNEADYAEMLAYGAVEGVTATLQRLAEYLPTMA